MVLDTVFQYYPANIYAVKPQGTLSLRQLIESIRNPKDNIKEQFRLIRSETDKKKRDLLKEGLFIFTPSVMTDGVNRGYDNIVSFNPLLVIEWDNLLPEKACYLKYHVFNTFKSCICAFLSPSKKGVKFIFRIPTPKSVDDYKYYWYALSMYLEDIEPNIDSCNERVTQVLYLSYDPNILVREDAEEWTKQTAKINTIDLTKKVEVDPDKEPCETSTTRVLQIANKMVENFDGENGHKAIVRISTVLGGYIAGGEISYEDAENFMFDMIDEHYYFSLKANTYKKTTTRFLNSGQNAPLNLED